jgi:hypothetical protein
MVGFPWAVVGCLRAHSAIFRRNEPSSPAVALEPTEELEPEESQGEPANQETLEHLRTIGHSLMHANNLLRGVSEEWIAAGERSGDSIEARRVQNIERFAAGLVQVHVRDRQATVFEALERALQAIQDGGTVAEANVVKEAIDAGVPEYRRLGSALVEVMETFAGKEALFQDRHYLGLRELNEGLYGALFSVRFRRDVGSLSRWMRVIEGMFPESPRRPE